MQGFAIDTTDGTASEGSFFTGTVQSPTITYCSFTLGDAGDRTTCTAESLSFRWPFVRAGSPCYGASAPSASLR